MLRCICALRLRAARLGASGIRGAEMVPFPVQTCRPVSMTSLFQLVFLTAAKKAPRELVALYATRSKLFVDFVNFAPTSSKAGTKETEVSASVPELMTTMLRRVSPLASRNPDLLQNVSEPDQVELCSTCDGCSQILPLLLQVSGMLPKKISHRVSIARTWHRSIPFFFSTCCPNGHMANAQDGQLCSRDLQRSFWLRSLDKILTECRCLPHPYSSMRQKSRWCRISVFLGSSHIHWSGPEPR